MENFDLTKQDLIQALSDEHLSITPTAIEPLRKLEFSMLTKISPEEEKFLRGEFIESLLVAHRARVTSKSIVNPNKINTNDVRTAMIMLGRTLANIDNKNFSNISKSLIIEICPYC